MIAERLLAADVADYVRFRAVCGPWRCCCASPRGGGGPVDGRFLPRRWIMIDKASPAAAAARRHRFLNVATGECIHTDLPELAEHDLLMVTPEGLLLLFRKDAPHGVRLLNPLTRHLTELPPFATVLTPEQRNDPHQGLRGEDFRVRGVAIADSSSTSTSTSTVVAYLKSPTTLAVAKPGDERCTKIDFDHRLMLYSTVPFAGRIYHATAIGIMTPETTTSSDQPPRMLTAVDTTIDPPFSFCSMSDSLHLVDNGGRELILVYRTVSHDEFRREYAVYRMDLDSRLLIPARSLSGRAVFIGLSRSVSISPSTFPSVTGDTVYLGFDCGERTKISGYHVGDGSIEHSQLIKHASWFKPSTLVDCLSWCIKSNGKQLGLSPELTT